MRSSDLLLEPVKKYRTSINPPYRRKDLISILGTLFILLAIPLTVFVAVKVRPWGPRAAGTAAAPTTIGSVIEPGSMVSGASYIVFVDGTNYYAKDGKTGEIKFSGSGDAAPVINAAINALPAGGGKVILSEGTFTITGTGIVAYGTIIALNSNVTLEGQGRATIIRLADNQSQQVELYLLGAISKSNCAVRNLVVDGNQANQGTGHVGINFNTVTNGLIENVEVKDIKAVRPTMPRVFGGNGIDISGSGVIVRSSTIHNTMAHGIVVFRTSSHITIEGNVIYSLGQDSLEGARGIILNGEYIVVANNNIYDINDDIAIQLEGARYSTVTGNTCFGESGIALMTESDDTTENHSNTVVGNVVSGWRPNRSIGYVGILIQRNGTAVHDNLITGNTISDTGRGGILVEGSSDNTISDNKIYDIGHDAGWSGSAIDIKTYNSVASNGNLIQGNKISNPDGHYMDYGIWVTSGCSGNIIRYNEIAGATETNLRNDGTGTIIQSNIGYLTENSGTATIASGSTYVDVNHGLAVTPSADDIQVTATNNLGNANKFWISNVGASSFRINVDVAPGASTATFVWKAEVK